MALAVPPDGGSSQTETRRWLRRVATPVAVSQPKLTVVIVNFCQWKNTARLTKQLRRSIASRDGIAEVVVVDNDSPKQNVANKLRKLSGVKLHEFDRNTGFATAVNKGADIATGDWMLLLNPDVTVADGFLDDLLQVMERYPQIDANAGVIGLKLHNRDGTLQASAGRFPTFLGTAARLVLPRSRRKCQHQNGDQRQRVEWVTGGCMLLRRSCFEQLRGLDERFFLYYEDVDFCHRATEAGWSVWHEPSLSVTHHWPLHARNVPAPLRLMTRHALITYATKHWPRWQLRLLAGVVKLESRLRGTFAKHRGDAVATDCYRELRHLVGDLLQGDTAAADLRVRRAASYLSEIAAAQDDRATV